MKKIIFLIIMIVLSPFFVLALPKGDVDGDNKVGASDYILVRKHILKNPELTGEELKRADVNGKDGVTAADYIAIRKIIISGGGGSVSTIEPTVAPTPTASPTVAPTQSPTSTPKPTAVPTANPTSSPTPDISVTSIKLNKNDATIKIKNTLKLIATVSPSNAVDKTVAWESSNTNIATVDKNGNIKTIGVGEVIITAKSSNGKTDSCTVKVEPLRILFIGNSKTFYNMYREFTINIATSNGYVFAGKQPTTGLSKYNFSGYSGYPELLGTQDNEKLDNYFYINVLYKTDDIKNSYYSYTHGGKSLLTSYNNINKISQYKDAIKSLNVDYLILQEHSDTHLNKEQHRDGIVNLIKLLTENSYNKNMKVFVRNTWLKKKSSDSDHNKAMQYTKDIVKELNADRKKSKSKYNLNITSDIKIINDGEIIWKAYKDGLNVFIDNTAHPSYLATYAVALATNKALFNINPSDVSYLPDILNKDKYKKVKGNPYRYGSYKDCKSKDKCDSLEKEQKQINDIIKLVNTYQK